ncbi:hypothetical protein EPO34_04635 [Patescibacteria group bacterium]|nr:MAG: hypothetical protein EPO34_04635 [Patescibacteria group bacterium]
MSERQELVDEATRLQLLKRSSDWLSESKEQFEEAVEWRTALLADWDEADLDGAATNAVKAYESREELVKTFFPSQYWRTLGFESEVESIDDVRERYQWARTYGHSTLQRQGRFEAISLTDIGVDMQAEESRYPLREKKADLRAMIAKMRELLFEERSVDLVVDSLHGIHRAHHVVELAIDRELEPSIAQMHMRTEFPCRIVGGFRASMDARVKKAFRVVLKQWSRHAKGRNPFDLTDHLGFRFICPDVAEAEGACEALKRFAGRIDATVDKVENNLAGGNPADASNPHSSPDHRMIKMLLRWQKRRYEIQIMTFEGSLSSLYASDTVNHLMYEFMSGVAEGGPIERLLPASIYGVDTRDRGVRRKMYRHVCRHVEWDD